MGLIEVITHKRCSKCAAVKDVCDFKRDDCTRDGYKASCRVCNCAADRARYLARTSAGIKRSRTKAPPEPPWPLPTHTLTDGLSCVRLLNWRGPVNLTQMRASL